MNDRVRIFLTMMWICILPLAGCGGRLSSLSHPDAIRDERMAIVTVKTGDTLHTLAGLYLGDPQKAHWIAEYNEVKSIRAGMRLAIPLVPVVPGGLRSNGYQTVPVLLYPQITPGEADPKTLPVKAFEEHLRHLRRNGFTTISLDRLAAFFSMRDQLPANAVVVTFDSAGRWVYETAYPLLKRYGYTAAVFVPTGHIGRPDHMNWAELAELAADGFDIAAGGTTARNLVVVPSGMDSDTYLKELEEQIALPISAIAEQLKKECRFFAYPEGASDDLIVALLKKHGYQAAFTLQEGQTPFFSDRFRVRRTVLHGSLDLQGVLDTFVTTELK
jgi:peptidoglycan/xylan/chitin deacetylase (PgdA/CDA1 family)